MWLLNTARAELKFFPTPESIPGGYAILSHVWDEHEQTFQDLQALRVQCAADGTNPRDLVCDKIRQFCILAERDGYTWVWADMCCIDKTSSTELSEAITSMYRYYALAEVCYVYLCDVPTASQDDLRARQSTFRESRWHKRGWTLQELVAPPFVVFLSQTWELLGAKADLADLLEEITRVPATVLKLNDEPSAYCVAARMSWAADRETTRPEDEAYCLMGIFGIFMPPLYGEGRNAFLRLQEEIMRQVDDPSIFAWGEVCDLGDVDATVNAKLLGDPDLEDSEDDFLARSPSDFHLGHHIRRHTKRYQPRRNLWEKLKRFRATDLSKLPTFIITPYGIMAHLPVFRNLASEGFLVALLLGIELEVPRNDAVRNVNVGLFLNETESPDPTRPLYASRSLWSKSRRLLQLVGDPWQIAARTGTTLEWRTIYIVRPSPMRRPSFSTEASSTLHKLSRSLREPFHIPQSHFTELLRLRCPSVKFRSLTNLRPAGSSWPRQKLLVLQFDIVAPGQYPASTVVIYLGLCIEASPAYPDHWAMVTQQKGGTHPGVVKHVCAEHHVDGRPRQSHLFTVGGPAAERNMRVELSFQPYALDPTRVRKVRIDFESILDPTIVERQD